MFSIKVFWLVCVVCFLVVSGIQIYQNSQNRHIEPVHVTFMEAPAAPSPLFSAYAIGNAERSTHLVTLSSSDGSSVGCSSVSVGPDRLLLAAHCANNNRALTTLDGLLVHSDIIKSVTNDKFDHLLIIFTKPVFDYWVKLANRQPVIGEPVFSIGYSNDTVVLRFHAGYVSSYMNSSDFKGSVAVLYQLDNYFGDSGSGVFNQEGYLLATESEINRVGNDKVFHTYTMSFPYRFNEPIQPDSTNATTHKAFVILPQSFCTTLPLTYRLVQEKNMKLSQAIWFLDDTKNAYMTLNDDGKTFSMHVSPSLYDKIKASDSWMYKDNGKTMIFKPCTT